MTKFIKRLIIIIIITLVADRILFYPVRFFYKRTTTTDEYKLNSTINKINDPVVFMGSSRCHHNYIPSIISDTLKTGIYNAGLWGARNIYFQFALLSNILERYTPKTICYEIHPTDYLQTPFSTIDKVGNLKPFIGYSSGCDDVLKKADYYYKSQLSGLYRYNSEFPNLLLGNFFIRTMVHFKGYKPLFGEMDTKYGKTTPEKFPYAIDKDKINYLQAFIDKCREKKINLIFLFAPMYAVEKNNAFLIIDSIVKKNGIPFINHYNFEGITGHPEYYYDFGHLNENGAKKYSSIIASELKKYIK